MNEEIRVEYLPLSEVAKWPRNPKKHDLDSLGDSIERWGFVQPITIDEGTGKLVAGHGRLESLERRKAEGKPPPGRVRVEGDEWFVPVLRGIGFASEQEAEAYLLADNRLVEVGGWDETNLKAILSDLRTADAIEGIGWSQEEIDELLNIGGAGDPYLGPTVDEDFETYQHAEIKQIVLYFPADDYDAILRRLGRVMEHQGMSSHTEAFEAMLEAFEVKLGLASAADTEEDPDEGAAGQAD